MKWKSFRKLEIILGKGIISKVDDYELIHNDDVCVANVLGDEDTDNV